ncbi:hypothetical protein O6H91_03G034200 [Diphasiastrum complanatum]|uniref:Uncharacterized protein n=1 Tax=Diphasiastrum complanatum TaxID=34168 RepID=A0ACC2E4V3_DIPCM|nr:hypothetical protein O6H91_03G034200 [Diphasiastrum complanatum]
MCREKQAVQELVNAAQITTAGSSAQGAHIHIVHLSDAGNSLDLIKKAKHDGAHLSVETCPHYLSFSAEEIPDGNTQYKCAPPIRHAENRASLWKALMEGHIDFLSSDHSPAPPELKLLEEGDFINAWGGISSLQLVLPATWTFGKEHGITLERVALWWSVNPAKLAKLSQKGSIEVGKDADLVIWDPETSFIVDENYSLFHKHKVTPYAGKTLSGQVISTFSRGNLVYHEGHHATKACGLSILSA